jgi:transglycosylase-like protein with SLT domain
VRRTAIVVVLVGSLLAGTAACSSSGGSADGHVSALTEASSPPMVDSPSPTPTPTPSATKTPVKPKSTKTSAAPIIVPEQPGCAGYSGKNLSASTVSALLTSAQKVEEWKGLGESRVDPRMWPIPKIVVPLSMLKAIAYMESGWRTGCKGRDGIGFGLMQMSAATADQVNLRFGESFDRMTPAGNAALGVAYLEWIIATLGLGHFGTDFDITKNSKFMDAVIEAYQQGPSAVLVDGHIEMNNPDYVTAVRAMMVSKPWA